MSRNQMPPIQNQNINTDANQINRPNSPNSDTRTNARTDSRTPQQNALAEAGKNAQAIPKNRAPARGLLDQPTELILDHIDRMDARSVMALGAASKRLHILTERSRSALKISELRLLNEVKSRASNLANLEYSNEHDINNDGGALDHIPSTEFPRMKEFEDIVTQAISMAFPKTKAEALTTLAENIKTLKHGHNFGNLGSDFVTRAINQLTSAQANLPPKEKATVLTALAKTITSLPEEQKRVAFYQTMVRMNRLRNEDKGAALAVLARQIRILPEPVKSEAFGVLINTAQYMPDQQKVVFFNDLTECITNKFITINGNKSNNLMGIINWGMRPSDAFDLILKATETISVDTTSVLEKVALASFKLPEPDCINLLQRTLDQTENISGKSKAYLLQQVTKNTNGLSEGMQSALFNGVLKAGTNLHDVLKGAALQNLPRILPSMPKSERNMAATRFLNEVNSLVSNTEQLNLLISVVNSPILPSLALQLE